MGMGRKNRKSSDHYAKRAGYDGKSKRRGYKSTWNGTDGQPRRGARIGADPTTGRRDDLTEPTLRDARTSRSTLPDVPDRCVVCRDPGGERVGDAPRLHRGCARRLARRGMRADLNRAARDAQILEAEAHVRDLEARAAARELRALKDVAPVGAPWTAGDLADLAQRAQQAEPMPSIPAPTLDATAGDLPTVAAPETTKDKVTT